MPRLVLDTNIVVSALLWGGTPRRIFSAAQEGFADLFTSIPLVAELEGVLRRYKFEQRLNQLHFSVSEIIDAYLAIATLVLPQEIPRTSPDPDDDMVLATALAAQADAVVSGDFHLLNLVSSQGIRILSASKALALLAQYRRYRPEYDVD